VLSCVLVHHSKWQDSLDSLVTMRRAVRDKHGISMAAEIKATQIRKGRGPLEPLHWSLATRMAFYADLLLSAAGRLPHVRIFSVAIDKGLANDRRAEPRETAWIYALQRVHRFCEEESDEAMLFPDEGHGPFIRRLVRRMRRFNRVPLLGGSQSRSVKTDRILEDPNDRSSHDSYFIQLADWSAYACHRSRYIDPTDAVDDRLWDVLAPLLHRPVNALAGGPPAIKLYPIADDADRSLWG
jgi:Protein of unknown function (DUF3800)